MSQIHSKDTKAELLLRKALWAKGYRFRKNYKKLSGSPDIVFIKKKVVIFVDGDFWHGNNWRLRRLKSRAAEFSSEKSAYWLEKIKNNIQRDKRNNTELSKERYVVLRYWESSVKKDLLNVIADIEKKFSFVNQKRRLQPSRHFLKR